MDTDDLDKPNIPGVGQEVEFTFGDLDDSEALQGISESDGQVSGVLTDASDFIDWYPEPSQSYGKGYTFLDLFNSDENNVYHAKNLYYPFSDRKDWEIVLWLLCSGLSMGKIDSFLLLEMSFVKIKGLPLSFSSTKELRGRAEMLPSSPCWMSQVLSMSHPTKSPVILYWHDPLDCIAAILNNPFFHDQLDFTPCRVYTTAQHLCCLYLEWMTGDDAWNMQSTLSKGATLLGTILSSDKMNISTMMGDRIAHPLLAACEGVMLSDPVGHSHYCFMPLASYIVDTLEAMMLATVGGKTSLVTMAMFKQFRDTFHHEPCTKLTTLAQLAVVQTRAHPSDLEGFFHEVQKFRLNSVSKPFWQDWTLAEPSHFLTPEFLHLIHQEFYNHDMKWIVCAVGDVEIDFWFSVLQPVTGFHHFHGGISKLKNSVDAAPSTMITAVQALMEFQYLIQSPHIDDEDIKHISEALAEFHANKFAITAGGFCCSSKNKAINNWYIPKLELMQSIVPSIHNTGVAMQWTTDTTEHVDKCHRFDLALSLMDDMACSKLQDDNVGDDVDFDVDDHDLPMELMATMKCPGHSCPITNYFAITKILQHKEVETVPLPLHTFVIRHMAFHLTYAPFIRSISVDDAAIKFGLSDLWPAIADFLHCKATHGQNHIHAIGGARRAGPTASLPFDKIQIWYDSVIVNNQLGCLWPADGLCGHTVGQIRLIMHPVGKSNMDWLWKDCFLVYVYCFDGTTGARDPAMQLHSIRKIKAPVNLIPRFWANADSCLTSQNSMEHVLEFWLNKFWDKNMFFSLSM
ncbi:hypothetical protein BDR05DRAFT_950787 [Suillus weaverae]|nr:hypothetical protein BDR05DRAFT_950787 [Suillus weaverae]